MSYLVYILKSDNYSYVGMTNDFFRRWRQHNKEIKGGAKATSIKVDEGENWSYVCYVENFPNWNEALKFEWRWKQISRQIQKRQPDLKPLDKRLSALDKLLKLDKPTSKALLYSDWEKLPNIVYINKN